MFRKCALMETSIAFDIYVSFVPYNTAANSVDSDIIEIPN
jgi:hypothetical protein